MQPVPFTAVQLTDAFWAPKIKTNAETTIPFAFGQCETSGRVENFIRAAQVLRGTPPSNLRPPGCKAWSPRRLGRLPAISDLMGVRRCLRCLRLPHFRPTYGPQGEDHPTNRRGPLAK